MSLKKLAIRYFLILLSFFSFMKLWGIYGTNSLAAPIYLEPNHLVEKGIIRLKVIFPEEYGVQKTPLHSIKLYQIDPNSSDDLVSRIKNGSLIEEVKTLKGQTSTQDKKYLSSVSDISFKLPPPSSHKKSASHYALSGRIFYCMFSKGLCTIYKFNTLVP